MTKRLVNLAFADPSGKLVGMFDAPISAHRREVRNRVPSKPVRSISSVPSVQHGFCSDELCAPIRQQVGESYLTGESAFSLKVSSLDSAILVVECLKECS